MTKKLLIENYRDFRKVIQGYNSKCRFDLNDLEYLRQLLDGRLFDLELLYRGSFHGFTADKFNAQCGSHQPTITLFLIVDAGCIGGFTS